MDDLLRMDHPRRDSSQIIVRPFPNLEDGVWPDIRTAGRRTSRGGGPLGDELFFVDNNGTLMVAPVETEASFSNGTPTPLIGDTGYGLGRANSSYAISSDGQRFLVMKREVATSDTTLAVIDNWFEEIRRLEATE